MTQTPKKSIAPAARVAQILSLTFVLVSWLHLLLALFRTGDAYMIRHLSGQMSFWLTLVGSLYVGVRITQRDEVAWWVGLAGAGFLLYQRVGPVQVSLREGFVFLPLGITLLWLAAFVAALVVMRFGRKGTGNR
jgi:hypothetical protein